MALTFAPQLVTDARAGPRGRARLRGQHGPGCAPRPAGDAGAGGRPGAVGRPGRGDGRRAATAVRADEPAGSRRRAGVLVLGGLLGVCVGIYGLLDGTASAWLGMPLLAGRPGRRRRRAARRRRRREPRTRYRPTRGRCPSGWSSACGVAGRGRLRRRGHLHPAGFYPGQRARDVPAGAAAGRARHPGRRAAAPFLPRGRRLAARPQSPDGRLAPPATAGPASTTAPSRERRVIEFQRREPPYDGDQRGASPTSTSPSPRASWSSSSGRPARASPRCCAPSTGWSRTSPAARCTAGSSSTAGTPAPTAPATSPTSSASSARTRSPAFVTDTVEDELAYGMESLGLAPDVMRRRVEETLDLLGLAELRHRPLRRPVRRPAAAGRDRRRC